MSVYVVSVKVSVLDELKALFVNICKVKLTTVPAGITVTVRSVGRYRSMIT